GNGSIVGITATGSAPLTYQWLDGASVVVGGDSANVMNLTAEDYQLTVTDGNGCAARTDTHIVSGGATPTLNILGAVAVNPSCGNNNGSITGITASGGTGTLTYYWTDGVPDTIGSALALTGVGAESYTIVVKDSLGCIDSIGPYPLVDQAGPILDITGFTINQSSCGSSDGSIIGISVTGGTGTLTFDWVNSAPASVGTALNLTAVPADSYTLTVTDSNGCTDTSGAHALNDLGAPVINEAFIIIDSSECNAPTGQILGMFVTGGTAPLTFVWNDPSLQNTLNATGLDCGTYSFLVTDANNCIATSTPQTVPCFIAPGAPVALSPAPYCTGDVIADLTATGVDTLFWYSNTGLTTQIATGSPFASGATTDTSYWVASTRNGCTGPATQVDLIITATPAAPFAGNDTAMCFGAVVLDTISIIGGTGTEWWSDNSVAPPFSLGTGDTLPISPGLGTNVYYVTNSAGTCQSAYDSIIVTLDAPITVTISGNTTICAGNSTTLTAAGGTTYLWSTTETTASITVSPASTTIYNVFATGGMCTASASDTVTVNNPPTANITASGSALLCAGDPLTLTADTAASYSWSPSGDTTQVIVVTPTPGTTIIYTLTVTNGCGSDIATQAVAVAANVFAGPDLDLCKNTDPIGFGATGSASPSGGTWSSPNASIFPGNLQPNGFLDHITPPWGSGYQLVYTDSSGNCSDTLLLEITGSQAGNDSLICPSSSTFFLPQAQPSNGFWMSLNPDADNAILNSSTGEVIKDGLAGDYTYVYISQGCPDSVTVNICGSNDVWVPNIFSPNGDQINSIVYVRGIALDWVHIMIYDRWGELVYDSGEGQLAMDEGWDGTYKGSELSPQVFVYFLEGAFLDGEVIEMMKGNITLVK
ncbi:MAG: gliding motility-associated C-terminal domain-containing protein, partial [Flavobacteriales bacterium]|nr:gliding motility-associated C-terminal domain-containing protein [Flavobacteriales bacterium]